jgi:hypothetical protein
MMQTTSTFAERDAITSARRSPRRRWPAVLLLVLPLGMGTVRSQSSGPATPERLAGHDVVLDANGRLLSWVQPQNAAYATVARLAWDRLLTGFPIEANGLPTWLSYCCFDRDTLHGTEWPHNPACVWAGLADGAAAYYAYSGDRRVIDFMRRVLDYHLANGTTPADRSWAWPSVPYASADHGDIRYRGAHDFRYAGPDDPPRLGRGDGYGVIEPDKVAELGNAYLTVWQLTEDLRYRDAALACAKALARHVRPGDAAHSPWPFRVVAETGFVREEYTANVAPALRLFDRLTRLRLGDSAAWQRARQTAWAWLLAHPFQNDVWSNYFEDVPWQPDTKNVNQYVAGELARYLLEHPEQDPQWRVHAGHLIQWIERTFGGDTPKETGVQWGAVTISEQAEYMYKMGSHTARFASILALWHEKTGDAAAKDKALRSFNWASYMCDRRGVVRVGPTEQSLWFSDGYGDYIRHFMAGMGAVAEWAPAGENHLLRSTSVVPAVDYAPGRIRYRVFEGRGEDVLRVTFAPVAVQLDGKSVKETPTGPGWRYDAAAGVLKIRREGATTVSVSGQVAGPGDDVSSGLQP